MRISKSRLSTVIAAAVLGASLFAYGHALRALYRFASEPVEAMGPHAEAASDLDRIPTAVIVRSFRGRDGPMRGRDGLMPECRVIVTTKGLMFLPTASLSALTHNLSPRRD